MEKLKLLKRATKCSDIASAQSLSTNLSIGMEGWCHILSFEAQ